ncbi:MAG: hypothetical protein JW757_01945 [Anaerolineales bacterium]|nr:hypothetical protein [Anaerolineales bacterium]
MDTWTELLSREEPRIRKAFTGLNQTEKIAARAHLIKMTTESGWHPEQTRSAQIALDAIKDIP